jgi:uncharacterized membrane protein
MLMVMELKIPSEKIQQYTSNNIHRIAGIDKLRGLAIIFMLLMHNFQFFEGDLNTLANASTSNPIASIIKFLGRWAGLFVIISGFVNTISIYHGIKKGKKTPESSLKELFIIGIWFIIIEHVCRLFFSRTTRGGGVYGLDEGPFHYSIITSWIETGTIQRPTAYSLYIYMSFVSCLGLALIILGVILFFLFRKNGIKNSRRNYIVLGTLGTISILFTPLGILWLRPIWIKAIEQKNIGVIVLMGILIGDTHPLLPLLGYILYGSILGLAFGQNIPKKLILRIFGPLATLYVVVGGVLYIILGDPPTSNILQTTPIQVTFLQIGLMVWLLIGVYWFNATTQPPKLNSNKNQEKKQNKPRKTSSPILEKFGRTSLTIYLVEGFLGTFIKVLILDVLFQGWATNFTFIILYSLGLISLWSVILVLWEKLGYKNSLEWITYHHIKPLARNKKKKIEKS